MFTFGFTFKRFGLEYWVHFPVESQGDKLSDSKVDILRSELERGFTVIVDRQGYHVASFDIDTRAWRAVEYNDVIINQTGKVMLCITAGQ